jgi:tRNA-splicing ligase RtcB (3'-phosphate/5'-hydroxy nucleic acid ligase)
MELAGRFAVANHAVMHERVSAAASVTLIVSVENHHNIAGREQVETPEGVTEAVVHRKGATPAAAGVLGIIPGSMADPGYLVAGRGVPAALNSASHGAGRAMSRRAAFQHIDVHDRDAYLARHGVELLGGGLDESPQAYKRIDAVIAAQGDRIDILGSFQPEMVMMAQEAEDI